MTSVQSASVASSGSLTRNERLDRLPFNKAHRKLLVASGIGWAFDAMDVGLVSFVVAAIAADPPFQSDTNREKLGAVHRLRRHGDRCCAGWFCSRSCWPQNGLFRDAGDFSVWRMAAWHCHGRWPRF